MYKVYKLTFENGDTYIGSTNNLERRLREHKSDCYKESRRHFPIYKCMRQFPNFTHDVLVEENCTQEVAFQLEQQFINIHNPNLNSQKAHLSKEDKIQRNKDTGKQNYQKNKEKMKEDARKYYHEHKEECLERHAKWREENKEKSAKQQAEYHQRNKEHRNQQTKDHREKHKEHYKELSKKWYEQHKEELAKKINCDCGSIVSKSGLVKHCKTKKHVKIMATKLKSV